MDQESPIAVMIGNCLRARQKSTWIGRSPGSRYCWIGYFPKNNYFDIIFNKMKIAKNWRRKSFWQQSPVGHLNLLNWILHQTIVIYWLFAWNWIVWKKLNLLIILWVHLISGYMVSKEWMNFQRVLGIPYKSSLCLLYTWNGVKRLKELWGTIQFLQTTFAFDHPK